MWQKTTTNNAEHESGEGEMPDSMCAQLLTCYIIEKAATGRRSTVPPVRTNQQ